MAREETAADPVLEMVGVDESAPEVGGLKMATKKQKKIIFADDVFVSLMKRGWGCADAAKFTNEIPAVAAVDVKQYEELRGMYDELRENFIDCICSGSDNLAPYCINRCSGCVDKRGYCALNSDECRGFNPAHIII